MRKILSWRKPERQVVLIQTLLATLLAGAVTAAVASHATSTPLLKAFLPLFACNLTAAFFGTFLSLNAFLRRGRWPQLLAPQLAVCLIFTALGGLQIAGPAYLPPLLTFGLATCLLLLLALGVQEMALLVINPQKAEKISLVCLTSVGVLAAATWEGNALGLGSLEDANLRLTRSVYFILALQPLLIWAVHNLAAQQRSLAHASSAKERRAWRINILRKFPDRVFLLALHWFFALVYGVGLQLLLAADRPAEVAASWVGSQLLWAATSLQALPACWWALVCWRRAHLLPRNIRSQTVHDLSRAANLLQQHHYGQERNVETWVGYRTAILMIDHDPNEECRTHLPSLLYRARQIQCQQLVVKTFSELITSLTPHGSQLTLSLDAETSLSPCTEALLILTVLYLDGLPLIERRLKNLVRLFPLLDPELGRTLSEGRIEALFSRLQGFFHLDFGWIDQSMQSGAEEANVEIRFENLLPRERNRVLSQLSAAQWLGNFIWISESARDQLRSESPFLASTVERWPIQLEQSHGRQLESAIFLIKFEHLIPRLQRYFGLDDMRLRLAPLPVSDTTQKLVEQIQRQLNRGHDFISLKSSMHEIKQHNWPGFRAKDIALDLTLRLVAQAEKLGEQVDINREQLQHIRQQAKELVQDIGYPSQDLHMAHMRKLELRQIHELEKICLDIQHSRCFEAWLLLASLPVKKLNQETIAQLLQLVATTCATKSLKRQPFILRKAVETFFQLARTLPANREVDMLRVLESLATVLVEASLDARLMLGFMDKKMALDQLRGHTLPLSSQILSQWNTALQKLLSQDTITKSQQDALSLRWKSFSQTMEEQEVMAS